MPTCALYGDFHEDRIVPFLLGVQFQPNEIDWNMPYLYIPLQGSFDIHSMNEMNEDIFSLSLLLSDLTTHFEKPNQIGIDLNHIQARYKNIASLDDVTQWVIRLCDIEEVLISQSSFSFEEHTNDTCD
ncbi:hypothetical protein [Paenibacillus sp. KN14-4R]|uniref:hypothetical protein n=1 Tax=Paenibacillus sp. KN14-4R TaxID=3445773 RepID=UPI003FA12BA9